MGTENKMTERNQKSTYTSCITIFGRAILPPVMTQDKVREMKQYKKLAVDLEKSYESKKKFKSSIDSKSAIQFFSPLKSDFKLPKSDAKKTISKIPRNKINKKRQTLQANLSQLKSLDKSSYLFQMHTNAIQGESDHSGYNTSPATSHSSSSIADLESHASICNDTASKSFKQDSLHAKRNFECISKIGDNHTSHITSLTKPDNHVALNTLSVDDKNKASLTDGLEQSRDLSSPKKLQNSNMPCRKFFQDISFEHSAKPWHLLSEHDLELENFSSPGAIIVEGFGTVDREGDGDDENDLKSQLEKLPTDVSPLSNPTSLASTDLRNYMEISPEALNRQAAASVATLDAVSDLAFDSNSCHENEESASDTSTLGSSSVCTARVLNSSTQSTPQGKDDALKSIIVQNRVDDIKELFSFHQHVRRPSYTLECPSPALIAHAALCEEKGHNIRNDMSSFRRHSYPCTTSVEGAVENLTSKPCCSEQAFLKRFDNDSIKETKARHLQRYLETISKCPDTFEVRTEIKSSDAQECQFDTDDNEEDAMTSLSEIPNAENTPSPPKPEGTHTFQKMLEENQICFEKMRLALQKEHEDQMRLLLTQQKEEEERLRCEFLTPRKIASKFLDACVSSESPMNEHETDEKVLEYFDNLKVTDAPVMQCKEIEYMSDSSIEENENTVINKATAMTQTCLPLKQRFLKKPAFRDIQDSNLSQFNKLPALVKGYLTRRLLKTERVQSIVKTIRDTLEFAVVYHAETPIKQGKVTPAEATLHKLILSQLTGACYEFHDVFFVLTIAERMAIISQDRVLLQAKAAKDNLPKRNLSSATLKSLERKKTKVLNCASDKPANRSKSALSWTFSPKRRRVNSESGRFNDVKNQQRARTTSPHMNKSVRHSSVTMEKPHRNARKNLSAIYAPESKKLGSGGQTFRVHSTKRFPLDNSIISPTRLKKAMDGPKWK